MQAACSASIAGFQLTLPPVLLPVQYCLASEAPLLLYSCSYEDLHFRRGQGNHGSVQSVLSEMLNRWAEVVPGRGVLSSGKIMAASKRVAKATNLGRCKACHIM